MPTKKKTQRSEPGRPGEKIKVFITRDRIHRRILEIAKQIRQDFPEEPLLLVGVLKGAVFFLSDLARGIPGEVSLDFIAVSSYGKDTKTSGQVRLIKDLDASIEGRTVIVVEDILDTGMTLQYLLRILQQRKPKDSASQSCSISPNAVSPRCKPTTSDSPSPTNSWSASASTMRSGTATSRVSAFSLSSHRTGPDIRHLIDALSAQARCALGHPRCLRNRRHRSPQKTFHSRSSPA